MMSSKSGESGDAAFKYLKDIYGKSHPGND